MKRQFGKTLRCLRTQAGKSMGELARYLEVSVPYLSDVERGNRAPLTTQNIVKAAQFFNIDPQPLLEAAVEWRGHVELEAPAGRAREVGVSLMRGWENLEEEDLDEIERILRKRGQLFMLSEQHLFPAALSPISRMRFEEDFSSCLINNGVSQQIEG